MKLRTLVAWVGIIGGVLLVAGGLGAWKYTQMQQGSGGGWAEMPTAVQIITAEQATNQRAITSVGTIHAVRWVTLAAEVAGKVAEVGFESGQTVPEGQLLLRLDSSTEQADLRAANAAADLAKATLERYETAMAEAGGGAVSKQELSKARAELEQSLAKVEQLKATIAKKEIRAPFAGRVGMRDAHPGLYLAEGAQVTTLQGVGDQVYVDVRVPQLVAAGVRIGSKLAVLIGGGAGLGVEAPATVTALDAQIDVASRNVWVRGTMGSMGGRLVPGMYVDVRVPVGEPETVVAVPPTAIRHAPFGDQLFVIEPDPKDPTKLRAHQRFVRVGGSVKTAGGDRVVVVDGLKAAEQLAGDGSFKLHDGAWVVSPPPPEGAAAAATGGR